MDSDQRRLYGDLAWTWPIISAPERYATEACDLRRPIERYSLPQASLIGNTRQGRMGFAPRQSMGCRVGIPGLRFWSGSVLG